MPGRARPPAADEGLAELHPVLRRLFAELEARQLKWLMLRVPSAPSMPSGDVDLLVAPADAEAVRDAAASLGFVALPGWETAPELILVSYDRWSDCWLVLDISTVVSFRAAGAILDQQTTEALLVRRRLCGAVAVPADDDAFWLLLLHCLLDKGEVAQHYRHRLRCLATATGSRMDTQPTPMPYARACNQNV